MPLALPAALLVLIACATPQDQNSDGGMIGGAVSLYQGPLNHLSAVRSGACPMYPSCSAYTRQAIERHGPVVGAMMATDRLMRCGRDELHLAPKVWIKGSWKTYDPLDGNDFWLEHSRREGGWSDAFSHPPEALGLKESPPS